jgi:transposase-like protein
MQILAATESEVTAKPQRRRFTAEYKRKILQEADACTKAGEISALLRREGLYSSHLASWRRLREAGELTPKKRGPKARPVDERDQRIAELERELAKQTKRAERAELIAEFQKKVGELVGLKMPNPGSTEKP